MAEPGPRMMPLQGEREYWQSLADQYNPAQVLSVYYRAFPEERSQFEDIASQHGAEQAVSVLLRSLAVPAAPRGEPAPIERAAVPEAQARLEVEAPPVRAPGARVPLPSTLARQPSGFAERFGAGLMRLGTDMERMTRAWEQFEEEELKISPEGLLGGMKTFGKGLTLLPKQYAARLVTSIQGHRGASVVQRGWGDKLVEAAGKDIEKFANEAAKRYKGRTFLPGIKITDVAELPANLAYSGVSLTGGLATGLPTALIPVPGARVAAYGVGAATAGVLAFNMASYEIMQEYLEARNEEMQQREGRDITVTEEKRLKKEFASKARKYGLWEAVPEAIGGAAGVAILASPLTKIAGKSIAARIVAKVGSVYAEEMITETVTQMGQVGVRRAAGLPGGREVDWASPTDWLTALKEIAPQTFLLTSVLAGAGATAVETKRAITSLKQEIGEQHPQVESFTEKIEEEAEKPAVAPAEPAAAIRPIPGRPAEQMPVAVARVPEVPAVAPERPVPAEVTPTPEEAVTPTVEEPTVAPEVPPPVERAVEPARVPGPEDLELLDITFPPTGTTGERIRQKVGTFEPATLRDILTNTRYTNDKFQAAILTASSPEEIGSNLTKMAESDIMSVRALTPIVDRLVNERGYVDRKHAYRILFRAKEALSLEQIAPPAGRELTRLEREGLGVGDKVLAPVMARGRLEMRAGTIRDASDPAVVRVRLDAGGEVTAGRTAVRALPEPVVPEAPSPAEAAPEEAPIPEPAEPELAPAEPEVPARAREVEALTSLGYTRAQMSRLARNPDSLMRITDQSIPAEEVTVLEDGTFRRFGGARPPRPTSGTTEELTAENIEHQDQLAKQKGEAGFVRLRRRQAAARGTAKGDLQAVSEQVTGSRDLADDFYLYREAHSTTARGIRTLESVWRGVRELVHAQGNLYLLDAARKGPYPESVRVQIRRLADDIRTQYQTAGSRAQAAASRDAYGIWGEMDGEQQDRLGNLIYLKSQEARAARGLGVIRDITEEQARQMFTSYFNACDAEAQSGFTRYDEFQRAFALQHLVDRGKLDPANVFDFYAPHEILDYLWSDDVSRFTMPVPLKPRYRRYLKKAIGSEKAMAVGLDVVQNAWSVVQADNMYEDAALDSLDAIDTASRSAIESELGTDAAQARFSALRPHQSVVVGDATYIAMQFEPGRYVYPVTVARPELLRRAAEDAALDVERLLIKATGIDLNMVYESGADSAVDYLISRPPDEQEKMLDAYFRDVGPRGGDAIREAIALGRYKRMYVVPKEVYIKMRNLRSKSFYVPLLRQAMGLTSKFKGIVLNWAFIPYNVFQALYVDTPMLALTSPGAVKRIPEGWRIVTHLPQLQKNPAALGPEVEQTYLLCRDQGVFESGFLREYMRIRPDWKHPMRTLRTFSGLREAVDRVAMVHYQLHDRVAKGLPVEAIHLEKEMSGLTEKQQVGYVGRKFTVDFEDLPDWYRRFFRGFLFPFITGTQKGAQVLGRLMVKMPRQRPLRFALGVAAPIMGVYFWNNTGWRKKLRDRLGWYGGRFYTTILGRRDLTGDGEADEVLIWSPRTNIDEAGEWIGIDLLLQKIHALRRKQEAGELTRRDITQAAQQQLWETVGAPVGKYHELLNPMIQGIEGIMRNRDPFDKRAVLPDPNLRGTPEARKYYASYMISKFMTPIEQLARQKAPGKRAPAWGPDRFPQLLRRGLGVVRHGPFNYSRAFGFRWLDLRRIERGEMRRDATAVRKDYHIYLRKVANEFIYNDDYTAEGALSFLADCLNEMAMAGDPTHEPNEVGRIIRDAQARGIYLEAPFYSSVSQRGSLANTLFSPDTWLYKYQRVQESGLDPATGGKLSKQAEVEIKNIIASLGAADLARDLRTVPIGSRPELIKRLLIIIGAKPGDVMSAAEQVVAPAQQERR